MSIGIDKIGFATSQYVLNMADLALARGVDPEKFSKGLMLDATRHYTNYRRYRDTCI